MKIIILYQNNSELNRFINYHSKLNLLNDILYFKSYIFKNIKYKYENLNNNYKNINNNFLYNYKKIYKNELNQPQLNHLLSIKKILELSIEKEFNSIMILEYDIYFHKDFKELFNEYKNLIANNDIIHLGSSQHRWCDLFTLQKINIKQWKKLKYYNNTHSLGTFALILKKEVYKEYLNFINYVLTDYKYFPSDVILSMVSKNYKSIVLYPNIIICNLDNSTIINKNRENDYIKFKWYKHKYIL